MKLKGMGINYPVSVVSLLCALTGSQGYAGAMGPAVVPAPGKVYAGIFGGGGSSTRTDISQFATAYFLESAGGPLAVDSFGRTDDRSMGIIGGQVGYQWGEILLNSFNSVGLVPAVELEGYYLGKVPSQDMMSAIIP